MNVISVAVGVCVCVCVYGLQALLAPSGRRAPDQSRH